MRIQRDPYDSWQDNTSVLNEVERNLLRNYGKEHLDGCNKFDTSDYINKINHYIKHCIPYQILDFVELAYHQLSADQKFLFQTTINKIMSEEQSKWLISDGCFFQIDSTFIESQILEKTHELLRQSGFDGALEEFIEARNDLVSGDFKGAIHNANKAFESTLKAVEERNDGSASKLISYLSNIGFYEGLPEKFAKGFGSSVLLSLPFIRNNIGGHGQGANVIDVPASYASLAVHLSGSFIRFLITRNLELNPRENQTTADDDLPF